MAQFSELLSEEKLYKRSAVSDRFSMISAFNVPQCFFYARQPAPGPLDCLHQNQLSFSLNVDSQIKVTVRLNWRKVELLPSTSLNVSSSFRCGDELELWLFLLRFLAHFLSHFLSGSWGFVLNLVRPIMQEIISASASDDKICLPAEDEQSWHTQRLSSQRRASVQSLLLVFPARLVYFPSS